MGEIIEAAAVETNPEADRVEAVLAERLADLRLTANDLRLFETG
jgi:hypothetical protein